MFIAAEITPTTTKQAIKDLEKEKKKRQSSKVLKENAMAVLALGKPIANLRVGELEALLVEMVLCS